MADRIKAVVLLGTGRTVADVAEALLLDEDTVHHYPRLYQDGGVDSRLPLQYHTQFIRSLAHGLTDRLVE